MNVVDEHHHGALLCSLDNLGDNDGESLLKLAGHLASRAHCPEVKLKQTSVAKWCGDVSRDYTLRETLHNSGLADAGLTEKHGIVLCASRENVNETTKLIIATNKGIEHLCLASSVTSVQKRSRAESSSSGCDPAAALVAAVGAAAAWAAACA